MAANLLTTSLSWALAFFDRARERDREALHSTSTHDFIGKNREREKETHRENHAGLAREKVSASRRDLLDLKNAEKNRSNRDLF